MCGTTVTPDLCRVHGAARTVREALNAGLPLGGPRNTSGVTGVEKSVPRKLKVDPA